MTASFKVASAGYFSIRSLVEEAIRRAEVKKQDKAKEPTQETKAAA